MSNHSILCLQTTAGSESLQIVDEPKFLAPSLHNFVSSFIIIKLVSNVNTVIVIQFQHKYAGISTQLLIQHMVNRRRHDMVIWLT